MLKNYDWTKRLKYLAEKRTTYYDNSFPGNCGEINSDGSISFDCIGMVKSVINEPDIVYMTSPSGYYVKPGQVIPDTTELGILELCTDVVWGNFSELVNGEYLYMGGHAGIYFMGDEKYNVIECTPAWQGGVQKSWVDADGTRRNIKGGTPCCAWEAHGKLSKYVSYSVTPQVVVNGKWDKNTTKLAQMVFKCKTINGKVVHQKKSYKKVCPACVPSTDKGSWYFTGTKGYSPLIAKMQKKLGINYPKTSASYGRFTIKTRKRFQKALGQKVDGVIKNSDVKAFQKWLNKKAKTLD